MAVEADARFTEDKDRVEAAFSKFDTDGNGYIDWDEFKEVSSVYLDNKFIETLQSLSSEAFLCTYLYL